MIVAKPYTITDAMLTSDIPEPDISAGEVVWTAGSYSIGDEVISIDTHKVYRSIVDNNTLKPDLDVYNDSGVGAKWLIVGPTNKWAFTDGVISNKSTYISPLNMGFEIRRNVDSVACFGLSGVSSATVTVNDPASGEVYNREVRLTDNSAVKGFYSYLFQPIIRKTQFVLLDLPSYVNASVDFEFKGTDTQSVGELVVCKQTELAIAIYSPEIKFLDFSIVNTDEFGDFTGVTRRGFSNIVNFDMKIDRDKVGLVRDQISDLRATLAVFLGEGTENDPTLTYGYIRSYTSYIDTPSKCSAKLQVQGVI